MEDCCCNCVPVKFVEKDGSAQRFERVSDADIKEYIRMVEIHRSFVYMIGKTVYPEYNFIAHDLSKFSSAELVPYTTKFTLNTPDEENECWQSALDHHFQNNPHHPQFWGERSMPEEYLKESIVDMVAVKYQYRQGLETLPTHLSSHIFDMKLMYLTRYNDEDRKLLLQELERLKSVDWSEIPVVGQNFSRLDSTSSQS